MVTGRCERRASPSLRALGERLVIRWLTVLRGALDNVVFEGDWFSLNRFTLLGGLCVRSTIWFVPTSEKAVGIVVS